jgi:hypothetical protein
VAIQEGARLPHPTVLAILWALGQCCPQLLFPHQSCAIPGVEATGTECRGLWAGPSSVPGRRRHQPGWAGLSLFGVFTSHPAQFQCSVWIKMIGTQGLWPLSLSGAGWPCPIAPGFEGSVHWGEGTPRRSRLVPPLAAVL